MDWDKIIGIVVIMLFFVIVGFYNFCIVEIPPNEKAVLFERFNGGIDKEYIYSGRQIIAPWDRLIRYDTSRHEGLEKITASSKDELKYTFELKYFFRIEPSKIGFIHEEIGGHYQKIIIQPAMRKIMEEMINEKSSNAISAMENKRLEDEIKARSSWEMKKGYFKIDSVSIQKITDPTILKN